MDSIALIIILLLTLLIPLAIFYFVYRWLSKKGYKKAAIVIISVVILFIGYSIFTAIYPNDGFYKDEFLYGLKIPFPSSGKILSKDASYPDTHGKYCSCFVGELNKADYKNTVKYLKNDPHIITSIADTIVPLTEEFRNVMANSHNLNTSNMIKYYDKREDEKNRIMLGLINKPGKTYIIFQRCNF